MAVSLLFCLTVGISDCDTLTARREAQAEREAIALRVRLSEIDAPAKAQLFYSRSRWNLSELCFGKSATFLPVSAGGLDPYGRRCAPPCVP